MNGTPSSSKRPTVALDKKNWGRTAPSRVQSGLLAEQSSAWRNVGHVLFFLILFSPTLYQPIKIGLLVIVTIAILVSWGQSSKEVLVRPALALPVGAIALVGVAHTIRGVLNGFSAGALSMAPVFVAWPLVFILLTSAIYRESHLLALFRIIGAATLAAGVYGVLFVAGQMGLLPIVGLLELIDQRSIYYSDTAGSYSASFAFLSTLLFTIPFLITLLLSWPREEQTPWPRPLIVLSLALGAAVIVLSGRRALLLVLLSSIVVVLVLYALMYVENARSKIVGRVIGLSVGGVVAAVIMINVTQLDVVALAQSFALGFSPEQSIDASIRLEQSTFLWEAWMRSPLLGSGLGGTTPGFVRDEASPWAYELSYNAYLYHFGIVGVTIYAVAIVAIYVQSVRVARSRPEWKKYLLPALVGLTCFLIGNATNPYLAKFDSLWVIFLPLMVLNVVARHEKSAA